MSETANTTATEGEVETPSPTITTDEPVLIVNGKAKKVGRHSSYLLDMLTIEDDK